MNIHPGEQFILSFEVLSVILSSYDRISDCFSLHLDLGHPWQSSTGFLRDMVGQMRGKQFDYRVGDPV